MWSRGWFFRGQAMAEKRDEDRELPIAALTDDDEFQCRATLSNVDKLAASIKRDGQLEAVLVRPVGVHKFQLIAGFTRVTALRKLGHTNVRARILYNLSDAEARRISLATNLEREDLTAWDQVSTVARYRSQGLSNAEIAAAFGGVAIRTIQRYLRVAEAPEEYKAALAREDVTLNQVYEAVTHEVPLSAIVGRKGRSVRFLRELSRKRAPKGDIRIQRRRSGEIIINIRYDPEKADLTQLLNGVKERLSE
jgi:ParB family transcriptional regulator, chromosome partitioning protein